MCYQLVEQYSGCRCLYYLHTADRCASYGCPGHPIIEREILVRAACPEHGLDRALQVFYSSHGYGDSIRSRSRRTTARRERRATPKPARPATPPSPPLLHNRHLPLYLLHLFLYLIIRLPLRPLLSFLTLRALPYCLLHPPLKVYKMRNSVRPLSLKRSSTRLKYILRMRLTSSPRFLQIKEGSDGRA